MFSNKNELIYVSECSQSVFEHRLNEIHDLRIISHTKILKVTNGLKLLKNERLKL